jgi:phosphatidylethanolamine/phosphatidyl-N-methylethanolamine N-methyltransferase
VTRALLEQGVAPERLTVIERDVTFAKVLSERYQGVNIIQGDAFDLQRILAGRGHFMAVLSGLPLLNFTPARRQALVEAALSGAPFIQFTYGWRRPVDAPASAVVNHAAFVWRNVPPAHVWVYRRA